MSFQKSNKNQTATSNSSAGYGAYAPTGNSQQKHGMSSAEILARLNSPMTSNGSGEALSRTMKAMQGILAGETGNNVAGYKLFPVDSQAHGLNISSVMFYCHNADTNLVSAFTFLIEASVGALRPRVEKTPEGVYEVPVVATDLYGESLINVNHGALARELGVDQAIIKDAGAQMIPRELAFDDEISIRNVIYAAASAIDSVFKDAMEKPEVFNFTDFGNNVKFIGGMDFRPGTQVNSVGLPHRRDVTVTVMVQDNTNNAFDQTFANSHMLSSASGYIDLVFTGKLPPQQSGVYNAPMMQPTQMYTPKFCIVDTSTLQGVTPELQMLALASLTKLSSGQHIQAWTNVYNPVVGGVGEMRDISALAIELDMPKIDTSAPDWNPQEFCNMYVDRDLAYCLHVEDAGELSWFHKIIKAAAVNSGAPHRLEALDYLYTTVDNLTGGQVWSKMWDINAPVAVLEDDLVFIGYWIDGQGKKRDLREIDYLYALKHHGEHDWATVEQFGYTFVPQTGPLHTRLARRKQLMETMLQQSLHIKSYAQPVLLDPEWLAAIHAAIAAVGGEAQFESHLLGQHVQQREHTTLRGHTVRGIVPVQQTYQQVSGMNAYYSPRYR